MPPRAPHLYEALRGFCLGAFAALSRELEHGAELPFAFEEHGAPGRPPLYEYRPLVRGFIEARAHRIARGSDARLALAELRRVPAAAIFARAHVDRSDTSDESALVGSVLMPLLQRTAESCGGFDWDDGAFERAYGELEEALFRKRHAFGAIAPLVGISIGAPVELGRGFRVRTAAGGEIASLWPEAQGLLPRGWGREPELLCLLEWEADLPPGTVEPPDAPAELADAITALRLATAGAIAAGSVVFERLDWRPYAVRPMLRIAAALPAGEPTRLDPVRGAVAAELLGRVATADDDPDLADALDRWESSLFAAEPARSELLRETLAALLGGSDGLWAGAMRGALLLGERAQERYEVLTTLRALAVGEPATADAVAAVRAALVETVLHGDRSGLVASLDEALLGLRPRPTRALRRAVAAA